MKQQTLNSKAAPTSKEINLKAKKEEGLLTISDEQNTTNLAVKNIRILLKRHFKGVKFSVRKRDYTCINVSWVDGPTKEAVGEVIDCFQEGSFDGMRDLYEYHSTSFNKMYGGVQYLFSERKFSDEFINETIEELREKYGEHVIKNDYTAAKYKTGGLWSECRTLFPNALQSKIDAVMSKKSKI